MKHFKRLAALILALSLLVVPGISADSYASRLPGPDTVITAGTLYVNGSVPTVGYAYQRMDFVWIKANNYSADLLSSLDVDDLSLISSKATVIAVSPANFWNGSFIKETGDELSFTMGDVILSRTRANFTGNGLASDWTSITLHPNMFAPVTALSQDDLPLVTLTETSLTAVPNNEYTRFEYIIIPESAPAGFSPEWLPLGSLYEQGGATALTAQFLPRSTPYTICVRIEGDDKQNFLYTKNAGIPITAPNVLYGLEKIGPLNGGPTGASWVFATGKGKKWTTYTAEPYEDIFIDLSSVFAKKEVAYQLKLVVDPLPEPTPDAAAASPSPEAAASSPSPEVSPEPSPEPSPSPKAKKTKAPPITDSYPTLLEGTFKARPVFPKTYAVSAFVSEQYWQNWTLTGGTDSLEYSADNGVTWAPFNTKVGLPLLSAADQAARIKAIPYRIRIAADEKTGVPASVFKKFNQVKQVKAPNTKPDYKKEIIKLKAGLKFAFGTEGMSMENIAFKTASGEPVEISDAIDSRSVIYVYTPENGKKSRSAMQVIRLAERAVSPDEGEGLIMNKNKLSLQKGFEYYGSKEKWGSFNKGDTKGMVRRKATAKYNAKTGMNTGLAASRPVNCTISYDSEGKKVSAIAMERKKDIPLLNWGLSSLSGGSAAYDSFADGVNDSFIVLAGLYDTVNFSIAPAFSAENTLLIDSLAVLSGETEVLPSNGRYSFSGLRANSTVTLQITPKNRDVYRVTNATITVIPPHEPSPKSVAFGSAGDYGNVAVVLESSVPLGQTRKLTTDLVRLPEGEVVFSSSSDLVYSPIYQNWVTFDFKQALSSAGPGSYELRAYYEGTDATSNSIPVTATKTFFQEDFGVRSITLTTPAKLTPGSTVSIAELRDNFGNSLSGTAYQWYRVTALSSYRYLIVDNAGGASYTVTDQDRGHYLEVLVYSNGGYFWQKTDKIVE